MAGGITSIGLPGAALGAGIGGSAVASLLTFAALAVLGGALGVGIWVFIVECARAARLGRRPIQTNKGRQREAAGVQRLGPCPWRTADEVDQARLTALRKAGL